MRPLHHAQRLHDGSSRPRPQGQHRRRRGLQHRLRKLVSTGARAFASASPWSTGSLIWAAAGTAGPYRGTRKNLFDVRRAAAIQNLEVLDRRLTPDVALQAAAEMTGAANRSAF
jgi:hypothetical protein